VKLVTWKYSDDDGNSAFEFECYETEIHRAAEVIAAEMDAQEGEYPDERIVDVWCPVQKRWRTMTVDAENVRNYSARETNESMARTTAERISVKESK
jgi:hypothetical protein